MITNTHLNPQTVVAVLRCAVLHSLRDPDVPREAVAAQPHRHHQSVPGAVHFPDDGLRHQQLCAAHRAGPRLRGEFDSTQWWWWWIIVHMVGSTLMCQPDYGRRLLPDAVRQHRRLSDHCRLLHLLRQRRGQRVWRHGLAFRILLS